MLDHRRWMRRVISQARENSALPFGAAIINATSGELLAMAGNRTSESPLWHAEIVAIRETCERHPRISWGECVLYTTAEPCPMCQSAILWTGFPTVVFGSSIPFLQAQGWWQIPIRASEVIARSDGRSCKLIGGVLEEECNALFRSAQAARMAGSIPR